MHMCLLEIAPRAMSDPNPQRTSDVAERLAAIEERLARLEAAITSAPATKLETTTAPVAVVAPVLAAAQAPAPVPVDAVVREEELEFEVGQNWFALAGVVVLTLGAGSLLALPMAEVAAIVPPLVGYAVAAALFAGTNWLGRSVERLASYGRGSAMALFYFSTLRLFFPLTRHAIDIDSLVAGGIIAVVVGLNLALALRRKSRWLTGLALAMGGASVALISPPWFALVGLVTLAAVATRITVQENQRGLALVVMAGGYISYLAWSLGPLMRGNPLHFVTAPLGAPGVELALVVIFAAAAWSRSTAERDKTWETVHAVANCALGYGVFFVHTMVAFPSMIAFAHTGAFVVFLGLAVAFWLRWQAPGPTFLYAMTGYAALSMAILKLSSSPAVFVWLSLQSLVVVTTAIWFRSRLIVVANFFIYVAMVLAYVVLAKSETGISVGFGVVALVSARILNWQNCWRKYLA